MHESYPLVLSAEVETICEKWADGKPDGMWSNSEALKFNLRTFARAVLSVGGVAPSGSAGQGLCPECPRRSRFYEDVQIGKDGEPYIVNKCEPEGRAESAAERRAICKACCTEVCIHNRCPNCHKCSECAEPVVSASPAPCGVPKIKFGDESFGPCVLPKGHDGLHSTRTAQPVGANLLPDTTKEISKDGQDGKSPTSPPEVEEVAEQIDLIVQRNGGKKKIAEYLRPFITQVSQPPEEPCLKDLQRRPRMGSAVIIRDESGRVLVGQRCKDPFRGYWVIPGGGIWPNETINAAAIREIKEETGLDIEITGRLGVFEDINATFHIILVMSFGRVIGGDMKSGDDCGELRWIGPNEFAELQTTPINKQVFNQLFTAPVAPVSGNGTEPWQELKRRVKERFVMAEKMSSNNVQAYKNVLMEMSSIEAGAASHNGQGWEEWLTARINEGMGAIEFGLTENGDLGLFRSGEEKPWATGDDAEDVLLRAMQKYPNGKPYALPAPPSEADGPHEERV